MTVHQGVDFWGGSDKDAPGTSFQVSPGVGAGPGTWTKLTADLARYQSLAIPLIQTVPVLPTVLNDGYLLLRTTGQMASDRLLSPERFSIGGYYTVRGYPVSEKIGDNGYTATAELVLPVPSVAKVPFTSVTWKQLLQLALFVDHGGTFAAPITLPQGGFGYLTGAGAGLRFALPFGVPQPVERGALSVKIDWASAIGRPHPSSRDQGIFLKPVSGDGAAGIWYLGAALQF
jgi:hemolysin activation/secretion protein